MAGFTPVLFCATGLGSARIVRGDVPMARVHTGSAGDRVAGLVRGKQDLGQCEGWYTFNAHPTPGPIACVTKNGGTLTFYREVGDQANFGQVTGTNAIPSTTTKAAIGNWNHATDRNWHGYIDFIYLWNRVLDLGARREVHNNPWQLVKPRLSGRTYVAYGITAPAPPCGDSGKGSIVIAIAS